MSADNMIYVQNRNDGRWWVWMGFASDDGDPAPSRKDSSYATRRRALDFAHGWYRGEMICEYGVIVLGPQRLAPPGKRLAMTRRRR